MNTDLRRRSDDIWLGVFFGTSLCRQVYIVIGFSNLLKSNESVNQFFGTTVKINIRLFILSKVITFGKSRISEDLRRLIQQDPI
jgi:hypothetical protein